MITFSLTKIACCNRNKHNYSSPMAMLVSSEGKPVECGLYFL